jgi:hypothetical protein
MAVEHLFCLMRKTEPAWILTLLAPIPKLIILISHMQPEQQGQRVAVTQPALPAPIGALPAQRSPRSANPFLNT